MTVNKRSFQKSASAVPSSVPAQPPARTLVQVTLWSSWFLLATLSILFISGLSLPVWLQYLPFVASLLLFGLPHGAVDHLVLARLQGQPIRLKPLIHFLLGYLILIGLYLTLWFVWPSLAFVLFIGMTWFHWGQGDLYTLRNLLRPTHLIDRSQRVLTILVRGGLPMLVPLLAFPEVYQQVYQRLIQLFEPTAAPHLTWAFAPTFRLSVGLGFASLILISLALGYRQGHHAPERTAWRIDVVETLLLALYFSSVPPILAIGIYFCFWHATRHIARLILIDTISNAAFETAQLRRAVVRFLRDAMPLTVGALILLAGLYVIVPHAPSNLPQLLALYLAFIAALTLPHIVVVCWMDWRQGVWGDS